ncbi:MAG: type II toxin-antitoxin system VapC family toxin [Steroidobacteraceae bacterium]
MIFLDASVLLAAEDSDDAQHDASSALLRTGALATLDLALYEATNVAIARWKDPDAAERLKQRIWMIAELGTLVRVDLELSDRIAQLATEKNLSTYDAGYVAGARRLGVALASCDERDLVSAGLAELPTALIPR